MIMALSSPTLLCKMAPDGVSNVCVVLLDPLQRDLALLGSLFVDLALPQNGSPVSLVDLAPLWNGSVERERAVTVLLAHSYSLDGSGSGERIWPMYTLFGVLPGAW